MSQSPLNAVLADLVTPLAVSLGLELWGIELLFGGRSVVRVFVETRGGVAPVSPVTIDQCAELSRLLGLSLDVEDCIPGAYVLEVSSPGLERKFFTAEQLARSVGSEVEITLHQPLAAWPGRRKFRGLLRGVPASLLPPAEERPQAEDDGGERAHCFVLQADDIARPGEVAPLVPFAFADLKKAVQVHRFPEQARPGKGGGKKGPDSKSGMCSEMTGGISHELGA